MTIEEQFRILAKERCEQLSVQIQGLQDTLQLIIQERDDLLKLIEGESIFEEPEKSCYNCKNHTEDHYGKDICSIKPHPVSPEECLDGYDPKIKYKRI